MRGNVLQMWTPASLLLTALLMVGAQATGRYHVDASAALPAVASPVSIAEHVSLPRVPFRRRPEVGHTPSPRGATAMLLVLMAQRARIGSLSR